jgi:hypothetical protein
MVGYKEVKEIEVSSCKGCIFKGAHGDYRHPCNHPNFKSLDEDPCTHGFIFVPVTDPQIKLISALDINLVDGLLQELTDICNEQGSRIRPSSGESIRDFIKRLIYNQHRDE